MDAILSAYDQYADQISLLSAKNDFMGKLSSQEWDNVQAGHTINEQAVKKDDEMTQEAFAELAQRIEDLNRMELELENHSLLTETNRNGSWGQAEELLQLQKTLEEIEKKILDSDVLLQERLGYKNQLLNTKPPVHTLSMVPEKAKQNKVDFTSHGDDSTDRFNETQTLHKRSQELLEGLQALAGLSKFSIDVSSPSSLLVTLQFENNIGTAIIELNSFLKVTNVNIKSPQNDKIDMVSLLNDTKSFPTPQDFRYSTFACQAALLRSSILRQHILELKKNCLVRVIDPDRINVTLASGCAITAYIHYAYPNVPSGVRIEVITGSTTRFTAKNALEAIKNKANCQGFSSLLDTCDFLMLHT